MLHARTAAPCARSFQPVGKALLSMHVPLMARRGVTTQRQVCVRYKPISEDDLQEALKDSNLDPQAKDGIIKAFSMFQGQQQREEQQQEQQQLLSKTGDPALLLLLQDRQQFVRDSIAQLSSRVDALDSKLTSCLDDVRDRVLQLSSRVDGLSSRVDGLSSRVDGLSSRVDSLSSRLDSLDSKLISRMDDLGSQLGQQRTFLWVIVAAAGSMVAKDWYPLISKLLP